MDKPKTFFRKYLFLFLAIIFIILFFIYSYFSKGFIYSLVFSDLENFTKFVNSFGFFSWMVFIFIIALESAFLPIPPLVLTLYTTSGILFGAFFGGVLVLIGNLLGSFLAFNIARFFGRKVILSKFSPKKRKKFDKFSEKYGAWAIFFIRLNPLTSSDIFSYLAGFTKIKPRFFIFATGLGLIPLIFLQTYLGENILKGNRTLFLILLIIGAIYLLAFIYLILKFFRKNN